MKNQQCNFAVQEKFCDIDNFILKFVSMCRKVSEVPPGYLLLVSFKIVRLATVLLGTFKTFKTTYLFYQAPVMETASELHYPGGVHDVSTTCEAPKGGIRSDPRNPACQYGEGVLPYCHLLCWKLTLFGMDAFLF